MGYLFTIRANGELRRLVIDASHATCGDPLRMGWTLQWRNDIPVLRHIENCIKWLGTFKIIHIYCTCSVVLYIRLIKKRKKKWKKRKKKKMNLNFRLRMRIHPITFGSTSAQHLLNSYFVRTHIIPVTRDVIPIFLSTIISTNSDTMKTEKQIFAIIALIKLLSLTGRIMTSLHSIDVL